MNTLNIQTCLTVFVTILISSAQSNAEEAQPSSNFFKTDLNWFFNLTSQYWSHYKIQSPEPELKLAPPTLFAGLLCFIAASISSAGGIGGGGLFVPILTIIAGLDLKTATSFSSFMVTGGSIANVLCNMFSPKFGGKSLTNYDIALLSEPCMLLGVSVGVICNLIFPEWLITILFVIFLVWSTFKTCKNGVQYWRLESEEVKRNGYEILENGFAKDKSGIESEVEGSSKEPLLSVQVKNKKGFPWKKFGILILIWLSFSVLHLLRGNRSGEVSLIASIILLKKISLKN